MKQYFISPSYKSSSPSFLDILYLGECRGSSSVPNKLKLSELRITYDSELKAGKIKLDKVEFNSLLQNSEGHPIRHISGEIEVKCSKEYDVRKTNDSGGNFFSLFEMMDNANGQFLIEGFMDVSIHDYLVGNEITFLSRCVCVLSVNGFEPNK